MKRSTPLTVAGIALLALTACTPPASGPDTPAEPGGEPSAGASASASASPSASAQPAGRQGWRITATNVLGEWLPTDTCGGDYIYVFGFGARMLETLTDLEGNQNYDGPTLSVNYYEGEGWGYAWYTNEPDGPPGAYVDGGKLVTWEPGPDGHPPETWTITGGWNRTINSAGSWDTHRGVDSATFRFERIPEPEWCLEDEAYGHEEGGKWEWTYYD